MTREMGVGSGPFGNALRLIMLPMLGNAVPGAQHAFDLAVLTLTKVLLSTLGS